MGILRDDLPDIPSAAELHRLIGTCLDQDRFCLVVQPIVDLRTGCAYTGEALSRLNHPELGSISADVFTPILETMERHSEFDLYIFRKCCLWMQQAGNVGKRFDRLSCNFSRATLSQRGLARELIRIADSYEIPHGKLGIEITEWRPATDMQQITENLRQLKEARFRIILDDYGSGVTSEWDLCNFPLDIVKLDHSLLQNAGTKEGSTEFRTLVSKLTQLGLKVVCEGIETEAQDTIAREAGCHYGQGFLYCAPLSQDRVFERIGKPFRSEAL